MKVTGCAVAEMDYGMAVLHRPEINDETKETLMVVTDFDVVASAVEVRSDDGLAAIVAAVGTDAAVEAAASAVVADIANGIAGATVVAVYPTYHWSDDEK